MTGGGPIDIVGVATDYAWDVVETAYRLGLEATCVDNVGGADPRLPGLTITLPGPRTAWTLGLSSAKHRHLAALALGSLSEPVSLVDPTAVVASTATIAHGAYVNAGVVIASHTRVGCHANVNRSASIGHDCDLGFASSIGPGAVLTGHVTVGVATFVGAGAVVLPGTTLGRGVVVGAGAVVTSDVADGLVMVGNPARPLRTNELQEITTACPHCSTT